MSLFSLVQQLPVVQVFCFLNSAIVVLQRNSLHPRDQRGLSRGLHKSSVLIVLRDFNQSSMVRGRGLGLLEAGLYRSKTCLLSDLLLIVTLLCVSSVRVCKVATSLEIDAAHLALLERADRRARRRCEGPINARTLRRRAQ